MPTPPRVRYDRRPRLREEAQTIRDLFPSGPAPVINLCGRTGCSDCDLSDRNAPGHLDDDPALSDAPQLAVRPVRSAPVGSYGRLRRSQAV